MEKLSRRTVQLLARHSDWQPDKIDAALKDRVNATATDWHWLLRMLFLALGFGFLACGILFFFAYNWADIPKFGKIGIAALGVALPVLLSLLPNLSDLLRKSLLTTGAFLVGPLFGVLGQIYQTGANAYDLFFAWTIFIVIWAIVVDFAPLWLLFIGLVNVSISLYGEQVAGSWDTSFTYMLLFVVNGLATLLTFLVPFWKLRPSYPNWFTRFLALAAAGCATIACFVTIIDGQEVGGIYLLTVLLAYGLTGWFAVKHRLLFYLVVMTFSLIIIGTAGIIRMNDDSGGFFIATIWVILTTTGSLYYLNRFRKSWSHE